MFKNELFTNVMSSDLYECREIEYLFVTLTRNRNFQVSSLVNVGTPGPWIEGRNEGRKFALQNVFIVPSFTTTWKRNKILKKTLLNYSKFSSLKKNVNSANKRSKQDGPVEEVERDEVFLNLMTVAGSNPSSS